MASVTIETDIECVCERCHNALDATQNTHRYSDLEGKLIVDRCDCLDDDKFREGSLSRDELIGELEEDVSRLTHEIEQLNAENIELKEQVRDLQCEIAQCPI